MVVPAATCRNTQQVLFTNIKSLLFLDLMQFIYKAPIHNMSSEISKQTISDFVQPIYSVQLFVLVHSVPFNKTVHQFTF